MFSHYDRPHIAQLCEKDGLYVRALQLLVGYTPDYLFLLQTILWADHQGAVKFALMLSQMEGGCPVDYNTPNDLFFQDVRAAALGIFLAVRICAGPEIATVGGNIHLSKLQN
ncbi:hypothetical protein OROMI_019879 [Orobanche minor]